ncbi:ABC transporter substrate-binding protein [Leptolyngbyaceae cyanobacterium CCMR0081]|uniref:ABC transporter substrate-binding protein n=2 Tax=Adonisia TaxID=2950183 RepID=A0A6M0RXU9_9CYAN|nr:ABC transporter substrate-binding protein [Adonisia turfae CCMR0081]
MALALRREEVLVVKIQARLTYLPSISMAEILAIAIAALWSNKLRTALTMLGVIIGITAVIAVTSVGQGVQSATEANLQGLGADLLQVRAGAANTGNVSQGSGSATTLTWSDAQAIESQVLSAGTVTAYLQQTTQVVYAQNNMSTTVLGTDTNYAEVNNITLQSGRFFTLDELTAAQPVAILGPTVEDELFDSGTAIGKNIRIQGQRYSVIGIANEKGAQGRENPDEQIYVPLTNMSARLVGNNALSGIAVQGISIKVTEQDQLEAADFQITNLLRVRHNIYPARGDEDDFRIVSAADLVETLTSTVGLFTIMVVAIAAISLVVGGIGIANIMLVSVVERTREIGIRKAVGATNQAILSQFLTEAISISAVGGGLGVGLGVAIAWIAATLFDFPFVISLWAIVLGVGLSFMIGIVAGVIPARSAAKLDPIIALRSD